MEERDKDIITQNTAEDEIDLIEIAAKLWANRRFIIKTTLIFMAIGLFIAIFTPNEYTATTTMVPQTGEKRVGGSLGGLAAIAGINLGSMSSGEVLSPSVYPKILNNVNFQKELIYSKYNFENADKPISYYDYATNKEYSSFNLLGSIKKYTIGLPGVIIGAIKGEPKEISDSLSNTTKTIDRLTIKESKVIKSVFDNLRFNLNDKEGYISLSYTSREPRLSAEVVLTAQKLLQKYITEFKIEKVRSNLEFVEKSYDEARVNFENKQSELARFRDANKNLSSAIARTQEEKLTSEYNLLLGIYTEIAKQKEQAKIAVTETTPILTVIEPVTIPTEKSGPRRVVMMVGFILLGLIAGMAWILAKPLLNNLVFELRKNNEGSKTI
jgi:uncharacterized protein involved in exopolysaccharide biosynthesis